MSKEKQIEERLNLSDTIDYAMRDWDDYIDECREEEIPPIDTFEEYIADYVLDAGYRKQSEVAREIFAEIAQILRDTEYLTPDQQYEFYDKSGVQQALTELKKKYMEGQK